MVRTNDPWMALEFCAAATRLGLGLEVTAEGGGSYALATRDADEGVALWWLLSEREGARITRLDLRERIDGYAEQYADELTRQRRREHRAAVAGRRGG